MQIDEWYHPHILTGFPESENIKKCKRGTYKFVSHRMSWCSKTNDKTWNSIHKSNELSNSTGIHQHHAADKWISVCWSSRIIFYKTSNNS